MLPPSMLPLPFSCCSLDACAVAGILMGNITTWSDPALVALNPGSMLSVSVGMGVGAGVGVGFEGWV